MATRRIEIPFTPGAGQLIKQTGHIAPGDVVEFFFRTCKTTDNPPFNIDWVKNGNFFVDSLPGNNDTFTGEFKGPGFPTGAAGGAIKSGSGQSSFSFQFGKEGEYKAFVLQPDTEYTVSLTVDYGANQGFNGKLNAGPKHD
jgi:hypothetical protein